MKKFIITLDDHKQIVDVEGSNTVYIFENITGYEDEVFELLEKKKTPIKELEIMVNSWGGKVRSIPIKMLVNSYYKNKLS
jgi:ATP-dependent protease ClpP protease subunit